jgi:ribosomal protein S1
MSEKKRRRINTAAEEATTIELVETIQTPAQNLTEEKVEYTNPDAQFYNEDGEFLWDAYEATCPSHTRNPNPHIKTQNGDKVYSREAYAQEFYDILTEYSPEIKPELFIGEIHTGSVWAVNQEWITVDIGYRELVYVKANKEPEEVRQLLPGDETAVLITETKGTLTGSISGGVKQKTFMDLRSGIEEGNTAWIGTVKSMIENGGYIVRVQGIDCFMPGSLAGINKLANFESIIGEEIYVVPVSFSEDRGTIVVSHRKYLQALIPNAIEELKANIGTEKTGKVTGSAKYGVFVEFDRCLTGMIHSNELNEETMARFKSRDIKPGEDITFFVKDIISNTKITLTQKVGTTVNPWLDISSRYQIPSVVQAKIKTKKEYGVFVNIEEGVTGLLHISEVPDEIMETYSTGDDIDVQITRIDESAMKVFLKLP